MPGSKKDVKENPHAEHRKRMKEDFRANGLSGWQGHRILEMLLFYSVPRVDTNVTAHNLYDKFGRSIYNVLNADHALLMETEGIGPESATFIKFISEFIQAYEDDYSNQHNVLDSHEAAKDYMKHKFLCERDERIMLVCLGNNNKVIFYEKIAEGSPDTVTVSPAVIAKTALRVGTLRVMLAHNHPNGLCLPSSADLRTTSIFCEELRRVDIELMDHIIVAPDGVYSMAENNMLPRARYGFTV